MKGKSNKLEKLREEMNVLYDSVPRGSHQIVCEKLEISRQYLYEINKGTNVTLDNERNRMLLKNIIKIYRKLLDAHIKKMTAIQNS